MPENAAVSPQKNRWILFLLLLFAALTFSNAVPKNALCDEAAHLLFGCSTLADGPDQAYRQAVPMTALHVLPLKAFAFYVCSFGGCLYDR